MHSEQELQKVMLYLLSVLYQKAHEVYLSINDDVTIDEGVVCQVSSL